MFPTSHIEGSSSSYPALPEMLETNTTEISSEIIENQNSETSEINFSQNK